MENFRANIQTSLEAMGKNTLDLLRRNNLLQSLTNRLLIDAATADIIPSRESTEQALSNHCQQEQLKDEAALTAWLQERCLKREELIQQLTIPLKLSKLAMNSFGIQAEAHFLQRKEALDNVTYSLLRVKESNLAHELYLQLEACEANFDDLARNYSEGPEKNSSGKVGPGSLMRAHPKLQQLLRTAKPGVVQEPVMIEQWWIVARLDERQEASLDDAMHQRMASELLQNWLSNETKTVVKSLFTEDDEISMPEDSGQQNV